MKHTIRLNATRFPGRLNLFAAFMRSLLFPRPELRMNFIDSGQYIILKADTMKDTRYIALKALEYLARGTVRLEVLDSSNPPYRLYPLPDDLFKPKDSEP